MWIFAATAPDVRDGVVRDVRITLGGVASRPWRAQGADAVLLDGPATAASAAATYRA